jgi:PncC family amidohydrolase
LTETPPQDPAALFPGPDLFAKASLTGQRLKTLGLTLATAESLTGGLLSAAMTAVPGSSAYFMAGVTAYSNHSKYRLLEVPWVVLNTAGAVSPESSRAMASGVARLIGADLGLSTTGIAGPDGGSSIKPVGLVYISVHGPSGQDTRKEIFTGDRQSVAVQSVKAALDLLESFLLDKYSA